jgi:hypothetical protein
VCGLFPFIPAPAADAVYCNSPGLTTFKLKVVEP